MYGAAILVLKVKSNGSDLALWSGHQPVWVCSGTSSLCVVVLGSWHSHGLHTSGGSLLSCLESRCCPIKVRFAPLVLEALEEREALPKDVLVPIGTLSPKLCNPHECHKLFHHRNVVVVFKYRGTALKLNSRNLRKECLLKPWKLGLEFLKMWASWLPTRPDMSWPLPGEDTVPSGAVCFPTLGPQSTRCIVMASASRVERYTNTGHMQITAGSTEISRLRTLAWRSRTLGLALHLRAILVDIAGRLAALVVLETPCASAEPPSTCSLVSSASNGASIFPQRESWCSACHVV